CPRKGRGDILQPRGAHAAKCRKECHGETDGEYPQTSDDVGGNCIVTDSRDRDERANEEPIDVEKDRSDDTGDGDPSAESGKGPEHVWLEARVPSQRRKEAEAQPGIGSRVHDPKNHESRDDDGQRPAQIHSHYWSQRIEDGEWLRVGVEKVKSLRCLEKGPK